MRILGLFLIIFLTGCKSVDVKIGFIPIASCILSNIEITPKLSNNVNNINNVNSINNVDKYHIVDFVGSGNSPGLAIINGKEHLVKKYSMLPDTIFNTELYFNTFTKISTIKGKAGYKASF